MAQQLTEILNYFLDDYIPGKKQTFGKGASVYNSICVIAPQKIYETNLVDSREYKVVGSVGQGNWAKVPWLAIFRNGIAESAQEGIYIVYLLSSDGNSLYLTLNQGVTELSKTASTSEVYNALRKNAKVLSSQLDNRNFLSDENISLGNDITGLGKKYEKGTILYKKYTKLNRPSESLLEGDLRDMIEIYEEYAKEFKGVNTQTQGGSSMPSKQLWGMKDQKVINKIFFGAPGTGKSYKVNSILGEERKKCFAESSEIVKSNHYADVLSNKEYIDCSIWIIDNIRILEKKLTEFDSDDKRANPRHSALQAYIDFLKNYREENRELRTTFHPDYDYAQFVGAYKPKKELNDSTNKKEITYSFVPQVFAKAYAAAWRLLLNGEVNKKVFLVIEEINRGNCAQIFGDIFQLLDRDGDGFSQYSIDADCDFAEWLETDDVGLKSVWDKYKKTVGEGKLKLPPNLNILATMNTSDQSLFPMDSAFKRRFDWEYVPISFDGKDAANFQIDIDGAQYSWQKFVETVNGKILALTESEDKQLGEFFIKPDNGNVISKDRFLGKVMFYLWNEVCKDEHNNGSFFRTKDDGYFTFQDLYKPEKKVLLNRFMAEISENSV